MSSPSRLASLQDYKPIVSRGVIEELQMLAERLRGTSVHMVNSTATGGGVAEILNRMVPLLSQLGIPARWSVIKGDGYFFQITKRMHNALHGQPDGLSSEDKAHFQEITRKNLEEIALKEDILFVHDPQPIGLVAKKREGGKWVWRCHIDVSCPNPGAWEFLYKYIVNYDAAVFSAPQFAQKLPIRQVLIAPSIDPLSDKNRELSQDSIQGILGKLGITSEKPIIVQISRFDSLKDPVGVIQAYRLVKTHFDCQLVLAGGPASDDPEAEDVLAMVKEEAGEDPDIRILLLPPKSDLEINALQRAATIVVQKSLREGFGLTVSEALWKGKPVVASAVGGIPLQVKNKITGLLVYSVEGTAYALRQLLSSPEYAHWLGRNGREHVRQNFLITRHLLDYLLLFLSLEHPGDVVYLPG